jgi:hypothetical protein
MIKLTERPEGASVQLRKNEPTPEGVAHKLPGGQLSSSSEHTEIGECTSTGQATASRTCLAIDAAGS